LEHAHFEVFLVFPVFQSRFARFVAALEDRRRQHVNTLFLAANVSGRENLPSLPGSSICRPAKVFAVSLGLSPAQTSLRHTSGGISHRRASPWSLR
jgi:hypothetical protein